MHVSDLPKAVVWNYNGFYNGSQLPWSIDHIIFMVKMAETKDVHKPSDEMRELQQQDEGLLRLAEGPDWM